MNNTHLPGLCAVLYISIQSSLLVGSSCPTSCSQCRALHLLDFLSCTLLNCPLGHVYCLLIRPQSLDIRDSVALGIQGLCEGGNGRQGDCTQLLVSDTLVACRTSLGCLATYRSPGMNSSAKRSFFTK